VTVVTADLASPRWRRALGEPLPFDAVLTATALHWLEPERVRALYAEAHQLLAPGGILANVDQRLCTMPASAQWASHGAISGTRSWSGSDNCATVAALRAPSPLWASAGTVRSCRSVVALA
jgi:Methyltransferase domain